MSIEKIAPLQQAVALQRAEESKLGQGSRGPQNPGEAFESIMLKKMVQSLRSTVQESGLWQGVTGGQMYDHFIEQALSDHLAQAGGIGIAQLFEDEGGSPVERPSAAGVLGNELQSSTSDTPQHDEGVRDDVYAHWLNGSLQYDSLLNIRRRTDAPGHVIGKLR